MIEKVEFTQFQVLKNATLKLKPLTLLIGPNGSGKTTALKGIKLFSIPEVRRTVNENGVAGVLNVLSSMPEYSLSRVRTQGAKMDEPNPLLTIHIRSPIGIKCVQRSWDKNGRVDFHHDGKAAFRFSLFDFDHNAIASTCTVKPSLVLDENGGNLAAVLDRLRDIAPERFDEINHQLAQWMPEFDQILFDVPENEEGKKSLSLRRRSGKIPARGLSQGTLFALAMLTLAWLPEPPEVIAIEEPDHGIHPRLLRQVVDALRRLAFPQEMGEPNRKPVQVIATTHSPMMLDFFRDHPEEIVISEKKGDEATFSSLSDRDDLKDILHDTNLGDLWYSGVLGGVPAGT